MESNKITIITPYNVFFLSLLLIVLGGASYSPNHFNFIYLLFDVLFLIITIVATSRVKCIRDKVFCIFAYMTFILLICLRFSVV